MVENATNPADAPYSGDLGPVENDFNRNPVIEPKPVPLFAYGNRVRIAALHKNYEPYVDKLVSVAGWARSTRVGGENLFFIELNDGSCQSSVQIVVSGDIPNMEDLKVTKVGSSYSVTGKLIRSPAEGQAFEIQVCSQAVHKCKLVGNAPADKYPLPTKRHTNEFLRTQAHLRGRTKLISAVMRVRNNLAYATHKFFQERGFQYIHTPIITASDCEGAGEMLQVSTLMPDHNKPISEMKLIERVGGENEEGKAEEGQVSKSYAKKLAKKQAALDAKKNKGAAGGKPAGGAQGQKGGAAASDAASAASTQISTTAPAEEEKKGDDFQALETRLAENQWLGGAKPAKEDAEKFAALAEAPNSTTYPRTFAWYQLTSRFPAEIREAWTAAVAGEAAAGGEIIPFEDRKIDYRQDFFKKPAFLTVSGQINVETYACGMGDVYTFGPTFRAEKSDTSRHLAEFWMIEPELCFAELSDVMDCAEDYVKYCLRYIMENNADDVEFLNQWVDKSLKERLNTVITKDFVRLSYTEAIAVLEDHLKTKKVKKFNEKPYWGIDMGSEHERYLAEKVYNGPISVYDFPKDFKAFYMRGNEDGKTVQAFDMLVPGIGELIGGSAREERLDKLDEMITSKGLNISDYWWYRELRMYGTQPHGGFGLGFERLVMMATGVENIRDVIPFPREWNKAEF